MGNLDAARSGDRVRALEELRDSLASAVDGAPMTVVAQLSAQYRACLAELAELASVVEVVAKHDELKARRAARRAAAEAPAVPGKARRKRGA